MKWKSQTHSAFGNFSNLEKKPGITTLSLKLREDDNLTGLQTITKKAFHILISKRTKKQCSTICHSKISSLGKLFLFLVQMMKNFELTLFFQHTDWPLEWTTNHHQALNILFVRDSTCQENERLKARIEYWVPSTGTTQHNSTQLNEAAELNLFYKNESHSALWHDWAQFNSIRHPVHYWAQSGLVWHIIKAAYLNPITKTSPLVQFEKIQLNLPRFGTVVHCTSQNLSCRTDCYAQNWATLPNLGRFSTIWHFNISFWGKYMTKL